MTRASQASARRKPVHYVVGDEQCGGFQTLLEFVGRRWTGPVLLAGAEGARRFTQYRNLVPGISDRLLAQRLKELEGYGLMTREVVPTTPVQIRYTPSTSGEELIRALQPLIAWGAHRMEAGQGEACRCTEASTAPAGKQRHKH